MLCSAGISQGINISFEDATRVAGYGTINFSAPNGVPFDKMFVENNLFSALEGLNAVYNKDVPDTVNELNVTGNILVTDGTRALYSPEDPNTRFANNTEFADNSVREDIIKHAPLLTDPRDLLKQPLFKLLENGTCAGVLREKGASALFAPKKEDKGPEGPKFLILRMDGLDLEGCDQIGDLKLSYDSIKPGVSTKMSKEGDEFYTPIPWWTKGPRYIVRAKARLQSPDVKSCLFLRDAKGNEDKVYFTGSVAEYNTILLEFLAEYDNYHEPGKFIGIRHEGGHGSVFVDSIEFIEMPEGSSYQIDNDLNCLSKWNAFGDCESQVGAIGLNGFASGIVRTIQNHGKKIQFTVSCKADECQALVFVKNGEAYERTVVSEGEWTKVTHTIQPVGHMIDIGVWHSSEAGGQVLVKDIILIELL